MKKNFKLLHWGNFPCAIIGRNRVDIYKHFFESKLCAMCLLHADLLKKATFTTQAVTVFFARQMTSSGIKRVYTETVSLSELTVPQESKIGIFLYILFHTWIETIGREKSK